MKEFFTMDDFHFSGKSVLVRVDLNSPYDPNTKKIELNERIIEHAKTIRELSDKNAKVVVIAHQGRQGDPDFTNLSQHAELLTKYVGKPVEFVDDVVGEKAINRIKTLRNSEILLLDNVRFLKDETAKLSIEEFANAEIVKKLSPLFDYFVLDCFSVSHRAQASVVGFATVLPCIAGRVMVNEIEGISKAAEHAEHPYVMILGGSKIDDYLDLIDFAIKSDRVDKILTCGVLGELCLVAEGYDLGKKTEFLKEKKFLEFLSRVREFIKSKKIERPIDLAIQVNEKRKDIKLSELPTNYMILDIGIKTAGNYANIIRKAKTIYLKGPAGQYETKGFDLGTKIILKAIVDSSAFSLIGGGHTLTATEKFINKKNISYVSLSGGALIEYLCGKKLPGIEALKISFQKYK